MYLLVLQILKTLEVLPSNKVLLRLTTWPTGISAFGVKGFGSPSMTSMRLEGFLCISTYVHFLILVPLMCTFIWVGMCPLSVSRDFGFTLMRLSWDLDLWSISISICGSPIVLVVFGPLLVDLDSGDQGCFWATVALILRFQNVSVELFLERYLGHPFLKLVFGALVT